MHLILYEIYQSYHPDRAGNDVFICDTSIRGSAASASAGAGVSLRGGFICGGRSLERGLHARAVIRSLGSGARALREYTYDASPNGKQCM
eukprot:5749646-Pleurochrysis_carterae.AAC.1